MGSFEEVHNWDPLLIGQGCLWFVLELVERRMLVFDRLVVGLVGAVVVVGEQTGKDFARIG